MTGLSASLSAFLAMLSAEPAPFFPFFEPVQPARPVQVMVHRGVASAAPENTRRAIEMAIADSFEWVEVDVRRTRDGVHVLFHDSELSRCSSGKGKLREQTLAELRTLDFGSWFAPRFKGESILTLKEAFELARGRVNLYLDIKDADASSLAREIVAQQMTSQVVVYGSPAFLKQVRDATDKPIALMTKWKPAFGVPSLFVRDTKYASVEIDPEHLSGAVCNQFHQEGVKVQAKALGEESDQGDFWRKAADFGVDWIQTDRPLAVLTVLAHHRFGMLPVQIAHHRGAGRYAPENTLSAIRCSVQAEADYIEIDLRTTSDGKHVLMHDRTVNRTTDQVGEVRLLSWETLQKADVGSKFGRPFAGERIPTLVQAIKELGPKSHFYLDAKEIPADELARILRDHQLTERSVVYQSAEYLGELKRIIPTARVMPPLDSPADLDRLGPLAPYAVDADWSALSKELMDACHAAGIRVFSDALGLHENERSYSQAIEWGIDVIQTDHPARVLRAVEKKMLATR